MKMKKSAILLTAIVVLISLILSGCSGYTSKYNAFAFVHSNDSDSASMSFGGFAGRMVFKLKCRMGSDGVLKCFSELQNGSAAVYCDDNGTKRELFSIHAGETLQNSFGPLKKGTIYVIVETAELCKEGQFRFELE